MQSFDYDYKVPVKRVIFIKEKQESNDSIVIYTGNKTYYCKAMDALCIVRKIGGCSQDKFINASFMDDKTQFYDSRDGMTLKDVIIRFLHENNEDIDNIVLCLIDTSYINRAHYAHLFDREDSALLSPDFGLRLVKMREEKYKK